MSDQAVMCPLCGVATSKATKSSTATNLLTNFFHEGISRVVPGLVVLALYAHKQITAAFTIFHDSSIASGLSILIAAWLIGLTLDIVASIFFTLHELHTGHDFPTEQEPNDERGRIRFLKTSGELVLYRSMCLISLFTFVVTPNSFSDVSLRFFPNVTILEGFGSANCWNLWLRAGIFVLFFWAFWRLKNKTKDKGKEKKTKREESFSDSAEQGNPHRESTTR